jgi:hypothetical protein
MYLEYHTMQSQKAEWGDGPWTNEPDKIQFVDEDTNYDCLIVRNWGGALCGYVGVPVSHPCYKKDYNTIDVEVHGGLTFSSECRTESKEESGICHIPRKEIGEVWWLGFDCGHSCDCYPDQMKYHLLGSGIEAYREILYVKQQIRLLAAQLKELENNA